ncbi:hypothetical protein TNCV_1367441 [Trichonephila clavipes]|nr:hypothetical protein TNCV_1367441 [Trichonephila clavipes]
MSDRGLRNSSLQNVRCMPSLAVALSTIRLQYVLAPFHPNFVGEHPRGGQGSPSSLHLPPTSREDLLLYDYLEYFHAAKCTIHLQAPCLLPIQTQVIRHSTGLYIHLSFKWDR